MSRNILGYMSLKCKTRYCRKKETMSAKANLYPRFAQRAKIPAAPDLLGSQLEKAQRIQSHRMAWVNCSKLHYFFFRILISSTVRTRATASVATSAASSSTPRSLWCSALALGWWGPHKGIVDLDGLVEELCSIQGLDSCARFGEGRILDECISL